VLSATPKQTAVTRLTRSLARSKSAGNRAVSSLTWPPLPLQPRWPSEDERKQQFLHDPDVLRVEPHRLLCRSCGCWLGLHPVLRYSQGIWPKHKVACKRMQEHMYASLFSFKVSFITHI
jgi:hypothetical protein